MDARAISCAGLIGPLPGLRAYFALTALLTLVAVGLWVQSEKRSG